MLNQLFIVNFFNTAAVSKFPLFIIKSILLVLKAGCFIK
ncbi:hypothetical protein B4168_4230 [Anoxybacillus flavithermus]|nr:hypothetical protein B4168_4230 [Anoxybacillus flavithermus]